MLGFILARHPAFHGNFCAGAAKKYCCVPPFSDFRAATSLDLTRGRLDQVANNHTEATPNGASIPRRIRTSCNHGAICSYSNGSAHLYRILHVTASGPGVRS